MKDLVKKALDFAAMQVGVREQNNNSGPQVDKYLASVGLSTHNPWCAAFVYYCIDKAAVMAREDNPYIRSGGCAVVDSWAKNRGILYDNPQPGDTFLKYGYVGKQFRAHHTGFVTEVNGAVFSSREGNSNASGSREGYGVFNLKRTNSSKYKFVRWSNLVKESQEFDKTYNLILHNEVIYKMPVVDGVSLCPVREWGKALGFTVEWNQEEQSVLFDGNDIGIEITVIDGVGFAAIRDLVESAGLHLSVNDDKREVVVTR